MYNVESYIYNSPPFLGINIYKPSILERGGLDKLQWGYCTCLCLVYTHALTYTFVTTPTQPQHSLNLSSCLVWHENPPHEIKLKVSLQECWMNNFSCDKQLNKWRCHFVCLSLCVLTHWRDIKEFSLNWLNSHYFSDFAQKLVRI